MYQKLLESRLNFRNGKSRGFEWRASELPKYKFDYEDGVPETISKIIALAIELELPVGEWVGAATKKELPIPEVGFELLKSNIVDETVHFKAFSFAANHYLISQNHQDEAHELFNAWNDSTYHPIFKACYAELGVFLISLAVMRIFGNESIMRLAANVSRDENRHVNTNRQVLFDIGHDFKQEHSIEQLVNSTLDWMLSDLTFKMFPKEFFMEQSRNLVCDGYAPELEKLTRGSEDLSPFEHSNSTLY